MPTRELLVKIVGDSTSLDQAFQKAVKSAQKFNQSMTAGGAGMALAAHLRNQADAVKDITRAEEELIKVRSRRASSLGPFRVAGVGLAAGAGLFVATQAVRELGKALETTGEEAFTTEGRIKNMVSALTSGNVVGAVQALTRTPQTLEELGISAVYSADQMDALRKVADGTTGRMTALAYTAGGDVRPALAQVDAITKAAGTSNAELARQLIAGREAAVLASNTFNALANYTSVLGQTIRTATGDLVTFKGAADDVAGMRGPGARAFETPAPARPGMPTLPPLAPSQRRELELIGTEGMKRIPLLTDRLRQLNNQMADFHGNQEQRLKILTNIKRTEEEIAGIYADQAAAQKAAAEAAKRAAEAAAAEAKRRREALKAQADAIKSAVMERLQARQTDVLNKRALVDAQEQMRVARRLGGPAGIREATRGLQDVRFDMMRARLERTPATLTAGGRFAMGAVVINVHGVTDPDAVARKVTEILKKRSRRTTTQTRPTAAGQTG